MTVAESGQRYRLPNGMTVQGLSETDTLSIYRDLFRDHCYLRQGITLREGACILDVGANTGLFVLYLNTILTKARVYAFEPIPAIHAVLSHNLRDHDQLQAEAYNVGMSDQKGRANFFYYPGFSQASTMYPDGSARRARSGRDFVISQIPTLPAALACLLLRLPAWLKSMAAEVVRRYSLTCRRVSCELWTLSQFLRKERIERVDLLKIDAERSERQILAGLDDADWKRVRQLVIEVHDGSEATREMLALLRARGFRATVEQNPGVPDLDLVYAIRQT